MKKFMAVLAAMLVAMSIMAVSAFADEPENGTEVTEQVTTSVAKVGDTEYATIDEAIANWNNNTTLTLLSDVTLSDVIKIKSTEYHILDLGTYTMTAASKKDAIQIENNGRSSASYALDIKADANTPGGITATGKAIVRTTGKSGVKDRPVIRFYGGVFNATYIVYHSGSNGTNSPCFYFYDGEYNATIYTNRSTILIYGGTFNASNPLQCSVDSSSYIRIEGGRFKSVSNSMGSDLYANIQTAINEGQSEQYIKDIHKWTFGTAKGVYNRDVTVDETGYYVVSEIEDDKQEKYEAALVCDNLNKTRESLYFSNVGVEQRLYYKSAPMAVSKNTSGTIILYDEADVDVKTSGKLTHDLTDERAMYSGTVTLKKGHTYTVKFKEPDASPTAEADIPFKGNVLSAVDSSIVDYAETTEDGIVTRVYSLESVTEGVSVMFKATENPNVYEIYAVANDDGRINRFSSAQLKFNIENADTNRTDVAYTLAPAEFVKMSEPDADGYVLFNFDGVNEADSGVGEEVLFATVTFEGYGKFAFTTVDTAEKAKLHTATPKDNIVIDYTVAGDAEGIYKLVLSGANINADNEDKAYGDIINTELYVPVKDLTVKIDFPNTISDNAYAYQDMTLTVSGGDLEQALTVKLGGAFDISELSVYNGRKAPVVTPKFENGAYVVEIDQLLTVNTSYVVTVEGAGYRTARYTVTMTEGKTLNFWNNVKDNDTLVEEKKDSSAKKVTFLAGDIVKDSNINIYDLSAVVSYFGESMERDAYNAYAKYDLNRDGKIDSKDVAYVLVSWNN